MQVLGNNNKILVTGGCGFLGSHIVPFLLSKGYSVNILDDLSTGSLDNIPLDNDNLHYIRGTVLDKSLVKEAAQGCDLIIHLASVVGVQLVYHEPDHSYNVSKSGTENILSTDKNIPVVLFSSSAVYGLTEERGAKETSILEKEKSLAYDGHKHGYATGKWELERIGKLHSSQGRKVMIVRPYNVVGERQSPSYGMVVPGFIQKSKLGLPLTIYDDGEQTRSFTCAATFTNCLYKLINMPETWEVGNNIINIGSDNCVSINYLAKIILEATQSQSKIEHVPYETVFPNKKDVRHRVPDLERLTSLIGKVEWPHITEVISNLVKERSKIAI